MSKHEKISYGPVSAEEAADFYEGFDDQSAETSSETAEVSQEARDDQTIDKAAEAPEATVAAQEERVESVLKTVGDEYTSSEPASEVSPDGKPLNEISSKDLLKELASRVSGAARSKAASTRDRARSAGTAAKEDLGTSRDAFNQDLQNAAESIQDLFNKVAARLEDAQKRRRARRLTHLVEQQEAARAAAEQDELNNQYNEAYYDKADQLENVAVGDADSFNYVPSVLNENARDAYAEARQDTIDDAHSEALTMNAEYDSAEEARKKDQKARARKRLRQMKRKAAQKWAKEKVMSGAEKTATFTKAGLRKIGRGLAKSARYTRGAARSVGSKIAEVHRDAMDAARVDQEPANTHIAPETENAHVAGKEGGISVAELLERQKAEQGETRTSAE